MKTIESMQDERHKLAKKAEGVLKAASEEKRNITAEESTELDRIFADVDALDKQIDARRRIDAIGGPDDIEIEERRIDDTIEDESDGRERRGGRDGRFTRGVIADPNYVRAFWQYMRRGKSSLAGDELRALEAGEATEGGNLTYEEFERRIVEKLDEANIMRQLATVIQTNGDRNIPVESGQDEASYLGEEAAYTEDLDGGDPKQTFSKVVLSAHKLAYIIKVSEELLYDSSDIDLEEYLARAIARKFAAKEEEAFVNGSGSAQPQGVFGAAATGKTAESATAFTADELIDLFHSVNRAYRRNGSWLANDAIIKVIRKFKDTNDGQYLWQPGLQASEPDRLLGRPIYASSGAPSTMTTGDNVIVFGDMSYYWIADRGARVIQRLNELYAGNGQVGFRAYERHDGDLLLSEAVKVLTLG